MNNIFKTETYNPISAVIAGEKISRNGFTKSGLAYNSDSDNPDDLMLSTNKKYWVNVYQYKDGTYVAGQIFNNEKDANESTLDVKKSKTISFEVEE